MTKRSKASTTATAAEHFVPHRAAVDGGNSCIRLLALANAEICVRATSRASSGILLMGWCVDTWREHSEFARRTRSLRAGRYHDFQFFLCWTVYANTGLSTHRMGVASLEVTPILDLRLLPIPRSAKGWSRSFLVDSSLLRLCRIRGSDQAKPSGLALHQGFRACTFGLASS